MTSAARPSASASASSRGTTLIVGLGNPGADYARTRHNLGWLVIDAVADKATLPTSKKFMAAVLRTRLAGHPVILAKPETFMNRSGEAVAKISQYYTIPVSAVWLVHDDIDLPFGAIRISVGRSAGGHRGVASVIEQLGSQYFVRFRVGIRPNRPKVDTERYVMQPFNATERRLLPGLISHVSEAVTVSLTTSPQHAATHFN